MFTKRSGGGKPRDHFRSTNNIITTSEQTSELASEGEEDAAAVASDEDSEMSFTSTGPSEVVIISTSGAQYHPITTISEPILNTKPAVQSGKAVTTNNAVVSSNPTLNLLLSQPIVTMAASASTTTVHPASLKRPRSSLSSTTSTSNKRQATATITRSPSHSELESQKPLPPPPTRPTETPSSPSYINTIRQMMHSFGDAKTPQPESAKLIEKIVQSQMELLLGEAAKIAQIRGSRVIGIEEFLFLLRNDTNKLARLVRYLQFKDLKSKLTSATTTLITNSANKENSTDASHDTPTAATTSADLEDFYLDFDASKPETFLPGSCQSRRVRQCYLFLAEIDTPLSGLTRIFTEDFHPDPITLARNIRLNDFTIRMSVKDYQFYHACRSASFVTAAGGSVEKFYKWIFPLPERRDSIKLTAVALEALQHLAHETVAILVELALIVKAEESQATSAAAADLSADPPTYLKAHEYTRPEEEDEKLREHRESRARYLEEMREKYFGEEEFKKSRQHQAARPMATTRMLKESICPETKKFATTVMAKVAARFRAQIGGSEFRKAAGGSGAGLVNPWAKAISPANLLEVMRRFEARPTTFERFSRCNSTGKSNRMRILCL